MSGPVSLSAEQRLPHLITWFAPEPRLVGRQGSAARGTAWVLLADMVHPCPQVLCCELLATWSGFICSLGRVAVLTPATETLRETAGGLAQCEPRV